jgi:intracellular multiplication protein IcmL
MAAAGPQVIRLKQDFYRDGFKKIALALVIVMTGTVLLLGTSVYLLFHKPAPIRFSTDNEWRILKPVPLNESYLPVPDLIQWVSAALPSLFNYDFVNYKDELQGNAHYFTDNGWKKFLDALNRYVNYTTVVSSKLFVEGSANGAPFILNQGLLDGRYSWWVQMPVNVIYSNNYAQLLKLQVLVVRVSTLNNLYGIAIENMIAAVG